MSLFRKLANRMGFYHKSQMSRSILSTPGFSSGLMSRLTEDWATSELSADSEIQRFLQPVRARSRILKNNTSVGKKYIRILKSDVLGHKGMLLDNRAMDAPGTIGNTKGGLDRRANQIVEDAWRRQGRKENCTVARNMSMRKMQEVILETCATDGGILIIRVPGFDNEMGYAWKLIECDHLDIELNKKLDNGNRIRMGKEMNGWGETIAYWLRKANPNEVFFQSLDSRYERVPARNVIHPFIHYRPQQTRELPWMASAMADMGMLAGYEEAETVGARLASAKMGVWETEDGSPYTGPGDGSGNLLTNAEPGSLEWGPRGAKLKIIDWQHPNSNMPAFIKTKLRGIAGALGVSYNTLADDMESVNFSSGRLGFQLPREIAMELQEWFGEDVMDELFGDWLDFELSLNPARPLEPLRADRFEKYNAPTWRGQRWDYIEPVKDAQAAVMRINAGLSTPEMECADRGIDDYEEHLEAIKANKELIDASGVTLPELFENAMKQAVAGDGADGSDGGDGSGEKAKKKAA
jgi:lambda family phage portal protein